jgi:hypothetical protein
MGEYQDDNDKAQTRKTTPNVKRKMEIEKIPLH